MKNRREAAVGVEVTKAHPRKGQSSRERRGNPRNGKRPRETDKADAAAETDSTPQAEAAGETTDEESPKRKNMTEKAS